MKMRHYIPLLVGIAAMALPAVAQDYEDDIYYNPDKAKKVAPAPARTAETPAAPVYTGSVSYPAADTYTPAPGAGLQMSVDEYNRHTPAAATAADSATVAPGNSDFTYTRRIERFHNPDVIEETGDEELAEYYYATEQPTVINVNVIDIDPWDWWGPSPAWRYSAWYSPYWNPYYNYAWNWGWGPAWNWGWGGWYDPYWSWSWGWGPSWGCNPGWGHCPGWGPSHAWRPTNPGANHPRRPAVGNGMASANRPGNNGYATRSPHASGLRPGSNGMRPSSGASAGTTTIGRGRNGTGRVSAGTIGTGNATRRIGTGTNRTGVGSSTRATRNPGVSTTPSNTHRATGAGSTVNNTTRRSTGTSNNRSTTTRSYNSNSTSTRSYNSSGSFGSSRSSGGSFGGGSRSTGGGGGSRGRR